MIISGERVYLRFFTPEDADSLLELMVRNRSLFERVVPARKESFYTLEEQAKLIQNWSKAAEEDRRYSFGIFLVETKKLIGEISLFEISRGPLQKCILGYCLDGEHNGNGFMTEAIRLVLGYAFKNAGFHRIEAGVMPQNVGSMRVLEKVSFEREGLARKNVHINGKWEDHVMFAILNEDFSQ